MEDENTLSREEVFQFMRDNLVEKIEVTFSGGNDEGHLDGVTYYNSEGERLSLDIKSCMGSFQGMEDADGNEIPQGVTVVRDRQKDDDIYQWVYRPATEYEIRMSKIEDALSQPIWDRYGGFAGEFSVYGNLVWEIEEERDVVYFSAQESEETWHPVDDEV